MDKETKKTQSLRLKIERIKDKFVTLGDLRPGNLSEQYNVCGTPGCRCKAQPPQKHGPYHQLSWTRNRKSTTRFVRQNQLIRVRSQVRNYERLQTLVNQLVDVSIELSDLELKIAKDKRPTSNDRSSGRTRGATSS